MISILCIYFLIKEVARGISRDGTVCDAEKAGYELVETYTFLPEDKYMSRVAGTDKCQHHRARGEYNLTLRDEIKDWTPTIASLM